MELRLPPGAWRRRVVGQSLLRRLTPVLVGYVGHMGGALTVEKQVVVRDEGVGDPEPLFDRAYEERRVGEPETA